MKPLVQLLAVEASPPCLQDNTGDLDRLKKNLLPMLAEPTLSVPFSRTVVVAESFRRAGFKGVAVVNDLLTGPELVDFLAAPPKVLAGVALDLGTTHLEVSLVDLLSGEILALANCPNSQIAFGADILSRIHFAVKGDGLQQLHQTVIADINGLCEELAAEVGLELVDLRAMAVSGNTTMVHFFLRLNPYHLCREPYIPLVNAPDPCRASDLALAIHPAAVVWVLPSVGSYFGGDLISGILASGLDQAEQTSMLIDVGTNAEVVLGNREWLVACAGAAGPALEGGVARMGMRAGPGAIEHVSWDEKSGDLLCQTIDNEPARGICGSGIIDLVAALYLGRIIDVRGKFRGGADGGRLIETTEGTAFVVVSAEHGAGGQAVTLGQVDLDALMRSKAAMYSILTTLVNQVGVGFADIERIFVAGAFGRHISPRQAITLGMLPDLPLTTYQPVGNSSLDGARRILLEGAARKRCRELVGKITYIELNVNQDFMIRFSGAKFIPHTDRSLFPSVPFFDD